jgi:hypothetical protein
MSVLDDLTGIQNDLQTLTTAVGQAVTDLSVPAEDSVGDQVLAAIVPVLTAAGYTVTAPATPETETSAEDSTDPSPEA